MGSPVPHGVAPSKVRQTRVPWFRSSGMILGLPRCTGGRSGNAGWIDTTASDGSGDGPHAIIIQNQVSSAIPRGRGPTMPRASKRRSGFDEFVHRAVFILIAVFVVLYLIAIFVAEQPVIALALMALIIVVPIGLMVRKRSIRKRQARFHVQQAQHLGQLLTVSGAEFEDIAADLFRAIGYRNVERIGRSGDLGVDLIGTDLDGLSVVIQCKRYGSGQKIGSPAIQTLMGAVVNHGADKGIFVTTSSYTTPALHHAQTARIPIHLIDGAELTRLATQASTVTGNV